MKGKHAIGILLLGGAIVLGACAYLAFMLLASLPVSRGAVPSAGLRAPVTVVFDRRAIPAIRAENRNDAFQALGFVTARDRLFQMDLMRRKAAGRLAEIFGEQALPLDRQQRLLALERAATEILAALPDSHKGVLNAYTRGVNTYLDRRPPLPPEFLALGYEPERWRAEDSLLVVLGMFQSLTWRENEERMLTVMARCLPPEVTAFLTPDTDTFSTVLAGGPKSRRPATPVPVAALARLLEGSRPVDPSAQRAPADANPASNNWVVGAAKSADGRAILANDMHLTLALPNVWYRADLRYGALHLSGLTLPGVPAVVVGSTDRLAWGFTNALTDTLDFVFLEIDPADPGRYKTEAGWRSFTAAPETIRIKGGRAITLEAKRTHWGPVSPMPILGRPVALKWSALDPAAVDLGLLDLDRAATLEQGIDVLNRAGIPSMNALLADAHGRIAWTLAGKIPARRGFDGAESLSWADGGVGWNGYLPAEALPRVIDPPEGYLVTANQRTLGTDYPHILGHNFENSYRAYRIGERLKALNGITERAMLDLQLDTRSEFYDFYRDLALSVLSKGRAAAPPETVRVRRYIEAWNGRADNDALGLPLIAEFRRTLRNTIIPAYLKGCRAMGGGFDYAWFESDTPLRSLLLAKDPSTLPERGRYGDWDGLVRAALHRSAERLLRRFELKLLDKLTWGRYNAQEIAHPFSRVLPALGSILNLPGGERGGCGHCVNVSSRDYGVTERMVVSPNHLRDGILHMPGGQSGHALSKHYRDQHPHWVEGGSLPFLPDKAENRLRLLPGASKAAPRGAAGKALRNSSTD